MRLGRRGLSRSTRHTGAARRPCNDVVDVNLQYIVDAVLVSTSLDE